MVRAGNDLWTHKRHFIPHPHGQAMECLLSYHKTSYHKILQSLRVVNMGDQIWLDHFEIWWVYWQHHQISKPYDNSVPWISQVWDIMRFYDKMSDQILKSTTGAPLLTWIN